MLKRVALFVLTNIAVLALLSVVWWVIQSVFGIQFPVGDGLSYGPLLIFSAVFGFGGALISLAMSKFIAKFTTKAKVIEQPRNEIESWLVSTVKRHAQQAGIGMPQVAIYDSPEPNAFATGARKNNALVAVSTGLLRSMSRDEADAVLGHEIAHVANGDMVTLTLLQGVLNTFVIFLSRIIGYAVDRFLRGGEDRGGIGIGYMVTVIVSQICLGMLAQLIVAKFSRWREFRADAGGAALAGRAKMIGALESLRRSQMPSQLPEAMSAFGIKGGKKGGLWALFRSHPPLEDRIAALQSSQQLR